MKNALNWLQNTISSIQKLDREINRIETKILDLLLEIETHKAYAELKYDGLFSFCIREFKWSENQTYSRIQAMRAMRSLPEIKQMIDNGSMSVTTVAQVQTYLRQEQTESQIKLTQSESLVIFESFQNKTSKEVKLEIAELKGERIKVKLTLELDEEAETLWQEARAKSAHQSLGSDLNCLKILMKSYLRIQGKIERRQADQKSKTAPEKRPLDRTAEIEIKKKNPPSLKTSNSTQSGNRIAPLNSQRTSSLLTEVNHSFRRNECSNKIKTQPTSDRNVTNPNTSFHIPTQTRRNVLARDNYQCRNCGSKYALQIDHIQPQAMGGTHHPDNLRVLCRSCNLQVGIKVFGPANMHRDFR